MLGRCWLERWQVQLDVQRDWGPYLNVTKPQWKQMRRDSSLDAITMKLNHGQFMRLSKLYSEVVAVPIYKTRQPSGNRYLVGCVAADMPALKENQTKRCAYSRIVSRRCSKPRLVISKAGSRLDKDSLFRIYSRFDIMPTEMLTRESLEAALSNPGEDYRLNVARMAAIVSLQETRVEAGIGDPQELEAMKRIYCELIEQESAVDI